MNVISFEEFRQSHEIKKCAVAYSGYLKTLANFQLEIEVNALLEEFSGDTYGNDFFAKGEMILKEITSRASAPVKIKIENLTQDTLHLV